MKKTSTFQNSLIWFGAGVSLAEILTGTAFAPLGMGKGIAAIVIGHIIGCTLFFLSGLIGGRTEKSAMETVKMSFGRRGGLLFAFLNVLQLVGWTAIMIYDGALAVGGIFDVGRWVWCLVIGALIVVWIVVGITDLGWINKIAMAALFVLTLVLCKVIFFGGNAPVVGDLGEVMSFGAAVELAVAMPLSWLPLISDYTREAEKPVQATLASTADLRRRLLLDVYHRYGCGHLYGRVRHRRHHGQGGARHRRAGNSRALHRHDDVPRRVVGGHLRRVTLQQAQRQVDGGCRRCGRYGGRDFLPDGRYHGFPVSHRLGFRTDDRHPDREPLPAQAQL